MTERTYTAADFRALAERITAALTEADEVDPDNELGREAVAVGPVATKEGE